mmetsp:Transcript_62055/g.163020  ORF Transcript_62055/g.163020 Transcript_62055/m.163020 type:complete len:242 (-) Transcript_62055:142-867(-)
MLLLGGEARSGHALWHGRRRRRHGDLHADVGGDGPDGLDSGRAVGSGVLREALRGGVGAAGRRRVVVPDAAAHVERGVGLVVPEHVQAAHALGLAASRGGDAVGERAARQEAAPLVAEAAVQLLVVQAGPRLVRATPAAADVVAGAENVEARLGRLLVLAGAGRLRAAGPGVDPDRVPALREEAALLVAEAVVDLLIEVARVPVVHVLDGLQVLQVRDRLRPLRRRRRRGRRLERGRRRGA